MLRDLRLTLRLAQRSPLLVVVVVLTIALGIGANLTVLGVVDAVVWSPLPYPNGEELVLVLGSVPEEGRQYEAVSYETYRDWRRENRVFDDLAAVSLPRRLVLTGFEAPTTVLTEVASSNYFAVLGVEPILGRGFTAEEELALGAQPPVVISHALWQGLLGGAADATSRSLEIDDLSFRVVGVVPPSFRGLQWEAADAWLPMGAAEALFGATYRSRGRRWLATVGRLGEEISIEQAREGMRQVTTALEAEYPQHYDKRAAALHALDDFYFGPELRQGLQFLTLAGLLVLILCSTNVGALLMVHALGRRREVAVRATLGAGLGRLVRQFTVQAVLLSTFGGVVALLLTRWITPQLVTLSEVRPATFEESYLGPPVLLASLGLVLLLGTVFGALPPLLLSRLGLVEALKEGTRSGSGSPWGRRLRGALVTLQIALGFILLAAAALLLQSLRGLTRGDPGFDTRDLLTVQVDLPAARYDEAAGLRFAERLAERVGSLPGVAGVTVSGPLLAPWALRTVEAVLPDALADEQERNTITLSHHAVLPGFFSFLGIPLLEGRLFTSADDRGRTPVVVVARSVAERLWPNGDAVGSQLRFDPSFRPPDELPHTVIGVVADARHRGFISPQKVDLDVYFSLRQDPLRSFFLLARTSGAQALLHGPIRSAGRELDPDVPLDRLSTMRQRFALTGADTRFHAVLASLFASLALLLVAVGLYGVLALSLREQQRELAVRIALGASRRDVARVVVGQSARLLLPGLLLGLLGCLAVGPVLAAALYGVSVADPATLLLVAALLGAVGAAAAVLPARRATKLDPARYLRSE